MKRKTCYNFGKCQICKRRIAKIITKQNLYCHICYNKMLQDIQRTIQKKKYTLMFGKRKYNQYKSIENNIKTPTPKLIPAMSNFKQTPNPVKEAKVRQSSTNLLRNKQQKDQHMRPTSIIFLNHRLQLSKQSINSLEMSKPISERAEVILSINLNKPTQLLRLRHSATSIIILSGIPEYTKVNCGIPISYRSWL